jgi:hypothetical protein
LRTEFVPRRTGGGFFWTRIKPRSLIVEETPFFRAWFKPGEKDIREYRKGHKRYKRVLSRFSNDPFLKKAILIDRDTLYTLKRASRESPQLILTNQRGRRLRTFKIQTRIDRKRIKYKYSCLSFLDDKIKGKQTSKRLASYGLTATQCKAEEQRYETLLNRAFVKHGTLLERLMG